MRRLPLGSTSIRSIGYDERSGTLEVEFSSGAVYRYFSVPADELRALISAKSSGTYFNQEFKRHGYQYLRVA